LAASRDNAQRNGIADDDFSLFLAGEEPAAATYDIVLANILAGPLVELAPMLSRYLKPGGIILLSGLLTEQQAGVLDAYDLVGFQEFYTQEPWLCLEGVKLSQ
jgi:ribosomal protein L11 methyltransferase